MSWSSAARSTDPDVIADEAERLGAADGEDRHFFEMAAEARVALVEHPVRAPDIASSALGWLPTLAAYIAGVREAQRRTGVASPPRAPRPRPTRR